jgi:short subunit dehydrogenase-like uncharacterized protein
MGRRVVVYGASGHTGRFVLDELRERGFEAVPSGRDGGRLRELSAGPVRAARADDPAALDRALAGADAVINTAGPFAVTAAPLVEAALRAGIPYLDVAAEIEANLDTFRLYDGPARTAGVPVLPAMAFYGGLADLLVTAAADGWPAADEVHVAYGLSGWHPTAGTRAAGAVSARRRDGRRVRFTGGRLEYHDERQPELRWPFPAPLGPRDVLGGFTMAEVVTVPHHLKVQEIRSYLTVEAARDLHSPETPAPADRGRSDQTFLVDVVVRAGGEERRAIANGRDIYAVTAPLVVEATRRLLAGDSPATGVLTPGEAFDARDFLAALAPHLEVTTG